MIVDLSGEIRSREQLLHALYDAAELEHSICCQYLFTAFSLKTRQHEWSSPLDLELVRDWKSRLLLLARQEMVHLGVICNLLTAVGGAPHLERTSFPTRALYYPLGMQFDLSPLSVEALDRFILFEKPWDTSTRGARLPMKVRREPQTDRLWVSDVKPDAPFLGDTPQPGDEILRIWGKDPRSDVLVRQIEKAAQGTLVPILVDRGGAKHTLYTRLELPPGPERPVVGYVSVSDLYAKIFDGLKRLAGDRPDLLFVNLEEGQISNSTFKLPEGYVVHDMTFPRIKDLDSALKAIQFVRDQGEGPLKEGGHHAMLVAMRDELQRRIEMGGPPFEPSRPVLTNPRTWTIPGDSPSTLIEHPDTKDVADLFNYSNETMLMMLARLFADAGRSPARFDLLRDTVLKSLMTMVIRPMGEMLTELPASLGGPFTAGAPFEVSSRIVLIHNRDAAWSVFRERLWNLANWTGELASKPGMHPRMAYVSKNLVHMANDIDTQLSSR